MSFCGEIRYALVRWRDQLRVRMQYECTSWADQGSNQCSTWKDEGSNQCASWADEGSNQCCDWPPCSWFCSAFYWIAKWVCTAWYWVANWVCQAWYWIVKWVCRAFAWVLYQIISLVAYVVWILVWIPCQVFSGSDGPAGRVKHVFVLVLENRSFDHMLGVSTGTLTSNGWTLGVGVDAVSGMPRTVDGPGSQTNTHAATVFPVRAGAPFVMPVDPPHEFCDVKLQLASTPISGNPDDDHCTYDGIYPAITMAGFVENYANQAHAKSDNPAALADLGVVMAAFTTDQLPVLSTLARTFAVCDRWFSALPGPTWPNRFFLHAATSGGLDNSPGTFDTASSQVDGYEFENGTIYDALDSEQLPWRVYHGDLFPQVSALAGMDLVTMATHFHDLDDLASDLADDGFDAAYVFIEPNYGQVLTHGGDFECGNSQHPIDDVTRGEALIKYVYESIRNSKYWDSSALLITYDEHGGFYDHVVPPTAVPPGDLTDPDNNIHGFGFDQQGVRVPAVVVSPWIPSVRPRGLDGQTCNLVDNTTYDHGSLLASVEKLYGLSALTQRDARANDFLHLLSASTPRADAPTSLPPPAPSGYVCDDDSLVPTVSSTSSALRRPTADSRGSTIPATMRAFVQLAAIVDARLHPTQKERVAEQLRASVDVPSGGEYLTQVSEVLRDRMHQMRAMQGSAARRRTLR